MQTLRREIDEKMHRIKLNYYDTHTHGDILSIITNDVDTINNTLSQNLTFYCYSGHYRHRCFTNDDCHQSYFVDHSDRNGSTFAFQCSRSYESKRKSIISNSKDY